MMGPCGKKEVTRCHRVLYWMLLPTLLSLLIAGCREGAQFQDEITKSVAKSFAEKPEPGQTLVFLDLSDSLSPDERSQIPGIMDRVVEMQPPNTRLMVYLLDSEMENAQPLQDVLIPDRQHSTNQSSFNTTIDIDRSKRDLTTKILAQIDLRKHKKTRPFTSCYLNSMSFANGFFQEHLATPQRVVWVGDLIEDCKLNDFGKYNLARYTQGAHPDKVVASYVSDLSLAVPKLRDVSLTAVFVPRPRTDGENPVPPAVIIQYWEAVTQKLNLSPKAMRFMLPADLALKR